MESTPNKTLHLTDIGCLIIINRNAYCVARVARCDSYVLRNRIAHQTDAFSIPPLILLLQYNYGRSGNPLLEIWLYRHSQLSVLLV